MTYLAICAIYRDEAPYLREWVELHRLVGVERFFLYDNQSADDHREVVAPYLDDGTVVVHDWPPFPGQAAAYDHCLEEHRRDARWIAFLDLDEFLFSPTRRPVSEVLVEYEAWPGVGVNRVEFGTSGHRSRPAGLVIESYVKAFPMESSVKSVVDPARTLRQRNPHAFFFSDDGVAVDENRKLLDGWFTEEFTHSRLQINHYKMKSEEEFRGKLARKRADTGTMRVPPKNWARVSGHIHEDAITAYVPALRAALGMNASEARTGHS